MKRNLYINFLATKRFEECDYYFKLVLRRAVEATLDYEQVPFSTEVSITLCDNEYIKSLNAKHRNKDSATDVLSFPMYDFNTEELFGEDRLIEALNQEPNPGPEELLPMVRQAVDDFVKDAPQFDDLTMLCFRYLGVRSRE